MIFGLSTPLWLANNWRLIVGALAGALMCAPLAYCEGRADGKRQVNAQIAIQAEKVRNAALKAEAAATLADMARSVRTAEQQRELQEIVENVGTNEMAGPAVSAVLARLRASSGSDREAAR